jgi:hypothetical protein
MPTIAQTGAPVILGWFLSIACAASLAFASADLHQTSRAGCWLAEGRAHLHELVDRVDLRVADVAVEPGVVAARLAKQLVERGVVERTHAARTSVTSGT